MDSDRRVPFSFFRALMPPGMSPTSVVRFFPSLLSPCQECPFSFFPFIDDSLGGKGWRTALVRLPVAAAFALPSSLSDGKLMMLVVPDPQDDVVVPPFFSFSH